MAQLSNKGNFQNEKEQQKQQKAKKGLYKAPFVIAFYHIPIFRIKYVKQTIETMTKEELKELMAQAEAPVIIAELQTGRDTPLPNAQHFINQLEPETHNVMDPTLRRDKIVNGTTEDAEVADENTNVITHTDDNGDTTVKRKEPVARIALALQKLIVKRAVAFIFGNPVILNAEPENDGENAVLSALKAVLADNKINTINRRVARSTFSTTEAAEYWYIVERPNNEKYGFKSNFKLKCTIFSPFNGDTLYPYFDENGDLIAFSREYIREDLSHKQHRYFETFTEEEHILWNKDSGSWNVLKKIPNPIGKIPVIYAHQNESEWADVQVLIERLETLLSNFADTNDYHAAPKIFVTGQINGWANKGESGAVIEGETDAKAQYLSWDQAPEAVKLEIETLLKMIYSVTQTPDISFDTVKGLNLSGVALKLLFMDAHLKVQDHAEVFNDYLQRRISVINAYLSQMNAGDLEFVSAAKNMNIEPEIIPYMLEDDQTKVNTLLAATGQKAILSQKQAIAQLGWVNDVDGEIAQIEEENNSASSQSALEPTF